MECPEREIVSVVLNLSCSSPEVQKAAVEKYMTKNVAYRHPLCFVGSGINSRARVLGMYRLYRILSPQVDVKVESVVFDNATSVLYLEIVHCFKCFFLPLFRRVPARVVTRMQLRKIEGLYYIALQEDFYHPEDFAALLLPPFAPFVRLSLAVTGTVTSWLSYGASFLTIMKDSTFTISDDSGDEDLFDKTAY